MEMILYVIILGIIINILANMIWKYIPHSDKRIDLWISFTLVIFCILLLIYHKTTYSPTSILLSEIKTDTSGQSGIQKTYKNNVSMDHNKIKIPEEKIIDEVQHQNTTWKSQKEINKVTSLLPENGIDNNVQHQGTLFIRVLSNSRPIPFIGSYVSCAKIMQPELYEAEVLSQEIPIRDECKIAFVNIKINEQRWLLDMYVPQMIMPNTNLEINGKIIPSRFVEETENGKSANYKIRLVKIK